MTRKLFTAIFITLTFLCACYGLYPRIRLESANQNVAIISDYREIAALAKNSGLDVDEAIEILKRNGLTGLMRDVGYGKGYRYAHDEEDKIAEMD